MSGFEGLPAVGRMLLALGAVLMLVGGLLLLVGRVPNLGKLPGDIVWRRGGFTLYFPLMTCLIASLLISLVLWLLKR